MEVYSNIHAEPQTNSISLSSSFPNKLVDNLLAQDHSNNDLNILAPKILLLEDTPLLQLVNIELLKGLGCNVDLAKTGTEAINMFRSGYDLIFLDIGLPDISGTTVSKAIRSEEAQHRCPRNILIALTASGEKAKEDCFEAGMDDFYTKPILSEQLQHILSKWLPHFFKN